MIQPGKAHVWGPLEVTAKQVERPEGLDLEEPDEGMKYVFVEITAENTKQTEYYETMNFDPSDTYVVTPEGELEIVKKITEVKLEKVEKKGSNRDIEAGGVFQVINSFIVPESQKEIQMVYIHRWEGGDKVLFEME